MQIRGEAQDEASRTAFHTVYDTMILPTAQHGKPASPRPVVSPRYPRDCPTADATPRHETARLCLIRRLHVDEFEALN
jgi:hypothetical protein